MKFKMTISQLFSDLKQINNCFVIVEFKNHIRTAIKRLYTYKIKRFENSITTHERINVCERRSRLPLECF